MWDYNTTTTILFVALLVNMVRSQSNYDYVGRACNLAEGGIEMCGYQTHAQMMARLEAIAKKEPIRAMTGKRKQ